jgi:hypothetical protein
MNITLRAVHRSSKRDGACAARCLANEPGLRRTVIPIRAFAERFRPIIMGGGQAALTIVLIEWPNS